MNFLWNVCELRKTCFRIHSMRPRIHSNAANACSSVLGHPFGAAVVALGFRMDILYVQQRRTIRKAMAWLNILTAHSCNICVFTARINNRYGINSYHLFYLRIAQQFMKQQASHHTSCFLGTNVAYRLIRHSNRNHLIFTERPLLAHSQNNLDQHWK